MFRARLDRLEKLLGQGKETLAVVATGEGYADTDIDAVLPPSFDRRSPDNLLIIVRKRMTAEDRSPAPRLVLLQAQAA